MPHTYILALGRLKVYFIGFILCLKSTESNYLSFGVHHDNVSIFFKNGENSLNASNLAPHERPQNVLNLKKNVYDILMVLNTYGDISAF